MDAKTVIENLAEHMGFRLKLEGVGYSDHSVWWLERDEKNDSEDKGSCYVRHFLVLDPVLK